MVVIFSIATLQVPLGSQAIALHCLVARDEGWWNSCSALAQCKEQQGVDILRGMATLQGVFK